MERLWDHFGETPYLDNPPRKRGRKRKGGGRRKKSPPKGFRSWGAWAKAMQRFRRAGGKKRKRHSHKGGGGMAKRKRSHKRRRASINPPRRHRKRHRAATNPPRRHRYHQNPPIVGGALNTVKEGLGAVPGQVTGRIISRGLPVMMGKDPSSAVGMGISGVATVVAATAARRLGQRFARDLAGAGFAAIIERYLSTALAGKNIPLISAGLSGYVQVAPSTTRALPASGVGAYVHSMAGSDDGDVELYGY